MDVLKSHIFQLIKNIRVHFSGPLFYTASITVITDEEMTWINRIKAIEDEEEAFGFWCYCVTEMQKKKKTKEQIVGEKKNQYQNYLNQDLVENLEAYWDLVEKYAE